MLFLFGVALLPKISAGSSLSAAWHEIVFGVKQGADVNALTSSDIVRIRSVFPFSSDPSLSHIYRGWTYGTKEKLTALSKNQAVTFLESEQKFKVAQITPSDPAFTNSDADQEKQWWLAKVDLPEAWATSKGSSDVTVAVLDTGINGIHEDLADGRVGAGYLSYCQVAGASGQCLVHIDGNIASNSNSDDNGHGTIVAGIIGAIPDNGKGIAGINWNVRLMPVKILDRNGTGTSSDVAAGIVWAADSGAAIINMSLGGTSLQDSAVLSQAIEYAFNRGVLVVAAAGNDSALVGADLDVDRVFPVCSDGGKNMVLGVTATDINDKKASFSNYGRACIDVSAPGTAFFSDRNNQKGILSTYYDPLAPTRNNVYVFASGTSMATPIVTGIAALVKQTHPDLVGSALRDRIIASVDTIDEVNRTACRGLSCTGRLGSGRINALKAVQTREFSGGQFVRDAAGTLYLIESGVKRPVSSFVFSQRGFAPGSISNVAPTELENIPLGQAVPPLDGTFLKSSTSPLIYLVDDEVLTPVSLLTFRSYGGRFENVVELSEFEISQLRKGRNGLPQNGALLKLADDARVFVLHEGKRRLISYVSFVSRSLVFSEVVEVAAEEFALYPEDEVTKLQPPQDGTLLRSDTEPTVYVVDSGILRPISYRAFIDRGYSFSNVKIVAPSEFDEYRKGNAIT